MVRGLVLRVKWSELLTLEKTESIRSLALGLI
jgi:hypothetical protein